MAASFVFGTFRGTKLPQALFGIMAVLVKVWNIFLILFLSPSRSRVHSREVSVAPGAAITWQAEAAGAAQRSATAKRKATADVCAKRIAGAETLEPKWLRFLLQT